MSDKELEIVKEALKRLSNGEWLFLVLRELGMPMKRWKEICQSNPKVDTLHRRAHDAAFYLRMARKNKEQNND